MNLKSKRFPLIYISLLLVTFLIIVILPNPFELYHEPLSVDLKQLATHTEDFLGKRIKTKGIVKFYASYYMYEDFWLATDRPNHAAIPVVVRFSGLSIPFENASIEVIGAIEYCGLEGGFYFLNAISWEPVTM